MGALWSWIVNAVTGLVGLVTPVADSARGSATLGRAVRWVLHFIIVALILVGLHFLNQALGLNQLILGRSALLRQNWLPILFLLLYALCWLGWWLWRLLVTEEDYPEFADITEAWDEACEALRRARIDLREVPLFLVIGRPEAPHDHLFQASRLPLVVKNAPARADAPLHVYATEKAVYVTCAGASLLGKHAALLAGDYQGKGSVGEIQMPAEDEDTMKTLAPGAAPGQVPEIERILARAHQQGRDPKNLTRDEQRRIRTLLRKDRTWQPPIRNPDEAERHTARFEAFCRLLVRDRWPYCPINGTLLLVPFAATDSEQDALDTGATCQRDLATARRVLRVNAPTFLLVCDLEAAPGFTAFLGRFNDKQRLQRVGQRCPLVPSLDKRAGRGAMNGEARALMLESLAQWICGSVVPGHVYKHFGLEEPGRGSAADASRSNSQLFLFMNELRDRQRRLGRLLGHGVVIEGEEPLLFGGCYLAGTGADAAHEQGFVAGVFKRLDDEENTVSWTRPALEEEAGYRRWVALGQTALIVIILAGVALLGYALFMKK
jgi:hypothetical protein